jgi:adenosylcobinamide-GDP ribazoletransferase
LADTADGLFGGHTVERRLEIMKDSRIGSYGALALGLSLLLRASLIAMILDAPALGGGGGGARGGALVACRRTVHARDAAGRRAAAAQRRPSASRPC